MKKPSIMKHYLFTLIIAVLLTSCKSAPKQQLSTAQKIAHAHGIAHWHQVKSFQFTFGGKDEEPGSGRAWSWNPKTDDITLIRNGEKTTYNRNNMDTITMKADRAFINDKFWALIPFQLVWDTGATISDIEKTNSPVKNVELNKLTITYPNEGGYTPGDAYDIYFDDDYIIREWSFRRGNQPEPSLSNTFEDYDNFKGLYLAQEHKKTEGDWHLPIRNISVQLED